MATDTNTSAAGNIVYFVPDAEVSEIVWQVRPDLDMIYASIGDPWTDPQSKALGMCRTDWGMDVVKSWILKVIRSCGGDPCPI